MRGSVRLAAWATAVLVTVVACGSRLPPGPGPSTTESAGARCGVFSRVPSAQVLFASDLSDRCQSLPTSVNPTVRALHDREGYRIHLLSGPAEWAQELEPFHYYQAAPVDDVIVELDVEVVAGSGRGLFGTSCRSEGTRLRPGRWYVFFVGTDGSYLIEFNDLRQPPGTTRVLASGAGPLPNVGANRIRVDCVGTRLSLFLNGQLLAAVDDESAATGLAGGLQIRSFEQTGLQVVFSDLLIMKG